jgi:hypothetical protein
VQRYESRAPGRIRISAPGSGGRTPSQQRIMSAMVSESVRQAPPMALPVLSLAGRPLADVLVFGVQRRGGERIKKPYVARWSVNGRQRSRSYRTKVRPSGCARRCSWRRSRARPSMRRRASRCRGSRCPISFRRTSGRGGGWRSSGLNGRRALVSPAWRRSPASSLCSSWRPRLRLRRRCGRTWCRRSSPTVFKSTRRRSSGSGSGACSSGSSPGRCSPPSTSDWA